MNQSTMKKGKIFSLIVAAVAIFYIILDIVNGAGRGDFSYVNTTALTIQQAVLWIAAAVSAYLYFSKGGGKENARFYKIFAWMYLFNYYGILYAAILTAYRFDGFTPNLGTLVFPYFSVMLIGFGALVLLSFAENLGKKKSLICLIIVCIANIMQIVNVVAADGVLINGVISISIVALIARLLLIFMLYEMVSAKYQDKDARNTK